MENKAINETKQKIECRQWTALEKKIDVQCHFFCLKKEEEV